MGATNIDVYQHSYSGKPEDDNYLGKCSGLKVAPLAVIILHVGLLQVHGMVPALGAGWIGHLPMTAST